MVVKLYAFAPKAMVMFESRVVLDGSQTIEEESVKALQFESRVVLDGSQTGAMPHWEYLPFESRVVLDGSQTPWWRAMSVTVKSPGV